jgi:thiol-disulfide isomerase/thioredoxin
VQLVVAFAATWSKGSEEMLPVLEKLSCKFPNVVFASVDVDELEVNGTASVAPPRVFGRWLRLL